MPFFTCLAELWFPSRGAFALRQHTAPYLPISPPPPPPDTPVWPQAIHWFAPSRRLDPKGRSRERGSRKQLGRDVLQVITHAWPLNGHVCYLHNNASRAAKSFIAPTALVVAPCQTHTHTHTCFQGGTSSRAKPHNLHQTLKVGLSSAHLRAHALVGRGRLLRLDKCACYETLTHIYPRCLPMKNSGSCSG